MELYTREVELEKVALYTRVGGVIYERNFSYSKGRWSYIREKVELYTREGGVIYERRWYYL